ncbi:NUDIX hydrolase [Brevibacterium otitidis]|uniref:NUDIX hydrolase n=1 Tax=Brevibacterium otitidis TaxID=53364 RepID=A0ABV5WY24_9MICO|nr:NUDIX hydrolase [Brevibacterium otitidis]BFF08597.1 NUDIX hydrolase [Brevibacterium otitidis]
MSIPPADSDVGRARPTVAVLCVVIDDDRVALVRRANPPDAGYWGFPGGKIEFGETITQAAERELDEETSLVGDAIGVLTTIDAFDRGTDGDLVSHFVLIAVACQWRSGSLRAGDDALEAGWFALDEVDDAQLALSKDVVDVARYAVAVAQNEVRA